MINRIYIKNLVLSCYPVKKIHILCYFSLYYKSIVIYQT